MQIQNSAAVLPTPKAQLTVLPRAFPSCGDNELIIKSSHIAINPVDWKIQTLNPDFFDIKYPCILGEDAAGTVVEVGDDLNDRFEVGDRVFAHCLSLGRSDGKDGDAGRMGGFQLYPVLSGATVAKLPKDIKNLDGVVLGLSVSTAAAGLYQKSTLDLRLPKLKDDNIITTTITTTTPITDGNLTTPFKKKKKIPQYLLLWGGSSSVGSSVIQLATASGYSVITTASPSNYKYCKSLGAKFVLDYHNPDVVAIISAILAGDDGKVVGAYDAIGSDTTVKQCAAILSSLSTSTTTTTTSISKTKKIASVGVSPSDLPPGVEVKRISSTDIVTQEPGVAKAVWEEYLPRALERGEFKAAPEPMVIGNGLGSVQKGLDRLREGVSAKKVVVEL